MQSLKKSWLYTNVSDEQMMKEIYLKQSWQRHSEGGLTEIIDENDMQGGEPLHQWQDSVAVSLFINGQKGDMMIARNMFSEQPFLLKFERHGSVEVQPLYQQAERGQAVLLNWYQTNNNYANKLEK